MVEQLVLVDDGCDEYNKALLLELANLPKVTMLCHDRNRGKGVALFTGMGWCLERMQTGDFILCMDSDGQHDAEDIKRFRRLIENEPAVQFALGERGNSPDMPWQSRMGNSISRTLFKLQFGGNVYDTQTGFRLLSMDFARLCTARVKPGRYETEMKMLMLAARILEKIHTVEIHTLYFNGNNNSKFNSLLDSCRVMRQFFNYALVSVVSFILEYLLYVLFLSWSGMPYLGANVGARIISAIFNFVAHKQFSFSSGGAFALEAIKYTLAVLHALLLGSVLLYLGVEFLQLSELLAKPLVDVAVFSINFFVLSRVVFSEKRLRNKG